MAAHACLRGICNGPQGVWPHCAESDRDDCADNAHTLRCPYEAAALCLQRRPPEATYFLTPERKVRSHCPWDIPSTVASSPSKGGRNMNRKWLYRQGLLGRKGAL